MGAAPARSRFDVVIVGGGIAGAALATVVARDGLHVAVLEASEQYQDRVRGESLMPWGVEEAQRLGLDRVLVDAGAHVASTWATYIDDGTGAIQDEPLPLAAMCDGVPGSLNLRHPIACAALASAAADAGARVVRGVRNVRIASGASPSVRFVCGGVETALAARLVVGADGRNSVVRRQAGITLQQQPAMHMMTGLLLDGVDGLPADRDFVASEGDLFMATFHQRDGLLRVYLCAGLNQRHRFAGRGGPKEFIRSAAFKGVPVGSALASATPAGPCATYLADDTWTDRPYTAGVVLVGDAAGHNNPIIGQGLSLSLRDVRAVRDVLRAQGWTPAGFESYATERAERMRRVRHASTVLAAALAEDAADRPARRRAFRRLQQTDAPFLGLLASLFRGPDTTPPEALGGELLAMIRGGDRL